MRLMRYDIMTTVPNSSHTGTACKFANTIFTEFKFSSTNFTLQVRNLNLPVLTIPQLQVDLFF
eukprot:SAG11_NODE_123_length_15805_cov_15.133261_12_plen_63_part_00